MSIADDQAARTMTVEEFLALPEDGISRELIRGELRERGMTYRNRFHSRVEAKVVFELTAWLVSRPEPHGQVVCGEAGFRLRGPGESIVGIDVAYVSPELLAATGPKDNLFNGPPVLAVEVLSPSDTHADVVEKVELYLDAGVVVWVVDPDLRTVLVCRPGQPPKSFNEREDLSGEPYLPGFHVSVAQLFAD